MYTYNGYIGKRDAEELNWYECLDDGMEKMYH